MAPMTTLHWASRFSKTCMLAADGASSSAVSVLSRACRSRAMEITLLLSTCCLPSFGHSHGEVPAAPGPGDCSMHHVAAKSQARQRVVQK